VRCRLPPIVRAKQKVYTYRRWLYEEIIRNKFFSNYNHSCFIHIVSFELELTSYPVFKVLEPKYLFNWLILLVLQYIPRG
jgi:hypothetical protein